MKVDNRFHCFGCGADGDVIDFVAQLYGLESKEAAEKIAADYGISYDNKSHSPQSQQGESNRRNSSSSNRRTIAFVCYVTISICWRNGKSNMHQSQMK